MGNDRRHASLLGYISSVSLPVSTAALEHSTFNWTQLLGALPVLIRQLTGPRTRIASNGRATISYTLGAKTHNSVLYLDGMNDGYILDSSGSVGFGFFEAQANGPFTNSSINGTFAGGTWFPPVSTSPNYR